jgi:hypothetical protein
MASSQPQFRLPLKQTFIADVGQFAYRFIFRLEIRAEGGDFTSLPFRLDTGTDFMTIPQHLANERGIPFQRDFPVYPKTAAGVAQEPSYISPVYFSFPNLKVSHWEFKVFCSFSPYKLPYCLFSLTDFVPHFVVRSDKISPNFPDGSVVFQLRSDHGGLPRA